MRIAAGKSQLLVVDVQGRLMPAVDRGPAVVRRVEVLARAAALLGVPATVSEQYPKGLGTTLPEVLEALARPEGEAPVPVLAKTSFSVLGELALAARLTGLRKAGRDTVVVCGAEAHVCVLQTLLHLAERGFRAVMVTDAVGARAPDSVGVARQRAAAAGVVLATSEMVVFEWLERADRPEFKAVSALIR